MRRSRRMPRRVVPAAVGARSDLHDRERDRKPGHPREPPADPLRQQRPGMGEQVMRQQDGLSVLHMREAWKHGLKMLL